MKKNADTLTVLLIMLTTLTTPSTADVTSAGPSPPPDGFITDVTVNSFKLHWTEDNNLTYTELSIIFNKPVDLSSNTCITHSYKNCTFLRKSNKNTLNVGGLTAGTKYTASIYSINAGVISEKDLTISTYTVPSLPDKLIFPTDSITNTSFKIEYVDTRPKFTNWIVKVNSSGQTIDHKNMSMNNVSTTIDGLRPGTEYRITVYTQVPGFDSNEMNTTMIFTRPSSPRIIGIPKQSVLANSFIVTYDVWDENYDYLELNICNTSCTNMIVMKGANKTVKVTNLVIATKYTLKLFTKLNNSRFDLKSQLPATIWTFTAPRTPTASRGQVNIREVTINLKGNEDKLFDEYLIKIMNETSESYEEDIEEANEESAVIPDLPAGTKYIFKVYAMLTDIKSENFTTVTTFTPPGNVQNITADRSLSNESSLYIKWDTTRVGHYDNFKINATCRSPNKNTTMNPYFQTEGNKTWTVLSNLDPGTLCTVAIVSVIQNVEHGDLLFGELVSKAVDVSTAESAPGEVTSTGNEALTNTILFTWAAPSNPNGYIRKYKTLVIDEYLNCTKDKTVYISQTASFKDAHSCQDRELLELDFCKDYSYSPNDPLVFDQEVFELHPYRNYTVIIQAYTKCWGEALKQRLQTKTAVPSAFPDGIRSTTTESSIELSWKPMNALEEGNGPITSYTVRKSFIESTCSDTVHGNLTHESTTSVAAGTTLANLKSYWDYNITISATTEAGEGPQSAPITYKTKQSVPGKIDPMTITDETDIKSATFNWSVPCLTNGIITKYSVNIINKATNARVDVTSDTTTAVIQKLDPYSNYSIAVRAYTSIGPGEYTTGKPFRTRIGVPIRPTEVKTASNTSSNLQVTWERLAKYTGPTNFTVVAIDSGSNKIQICETGYNFNATECTVKGLDAYWKYIVYVQAITDAGTNESKHIEGTTAESIPGNVTNIQLRTETKVTKPRSLTISWDPPIKRDLNGRLTHYYVQCTRIGEKNVVYSLSTNTSTKKGVVVDIQTGNYRVEVFAATIKGNGTRVTKTTTVKPGAPLKSINESGNTLLMQPGTRKVSDDERQLAVKLPLEGLLCNIRNGPVLRWGVIVSQENKATDKSFTGSVADFNSKVATTYKNWFAVKDMDSIPPYIATPRNWTLHCQTFYSGNRQKRAAAAKKYQNYIVGEDGKCSGVKSNQYCNGDLQPGRSYRVKSYACTEGGCTETEYSKPISTAPDLTVPIAAGVASAVVVLAIVGGVVFLLRRKRLICFAKAYERMEETHTRGEGTHLDSIEPAQGNSFSPGAIKLSDFPDIVEEMHKESDLVFIDAFNLLTDNSPKHPMTIAEQECCRQKNRYTNILPFDHSRVKLRPCDDIEGSDYINANYIPGHTSQKEYIAMQGPMQETFNDFWRMVWEQNVDTIVMLTQLMEKGRNKCDKYWPDIGEPGFYGELVVSIQSESDLSDYKIKIIEVKMKEEKKMVRHFSYLKWPDMGCPDTPAQLLEFVKAVRRHTNRQKQLPSGPTVVHCSAGVGRTGIFIAVDYLLQHIRDHDEVDIYSLVLGIRNHRLNMVQTEDQYIYIHECLKAFITTDGQETDEEDGEPLYMITGQDETVYENKEFQKD